MLEVRFKDVDPDTGKTSQDERVCVCEDQQSASWIRHSLEYEWNSPTGSQDPNREFYIKENGKTN